MRILGIYKEFCETELAMPVVDGQKSESEKFAGASRKQAAGVLCRAEGQAAAPEPWRQIRTRRARADHRRATAPRRRTTGHARAMAPAGIPPLLALEITAPGPPQNSGIPPRLDRRDGAGESDRGEERIAAELLLKLGVGVSPRTVRRYMRRPVSPRPCSSPQTRNGASRMSRPSHSAQ
jgi:hypothetical protein